MTSPWSTPAVPYANNSLTDVPTSAAVIDTSLNAFNPSSKSVCGAGTDDAVFGLVGADRVMLGSDFPWYDPLRTADRVAGLPGLSAAERVAILGGNAMRIFGLA